MPSGNPLRLGKAGQNRLHPHGAQSEVPPPTLAGILRPAKPRLIRFGVHFQAFIVRRIVIAGVDSLGNCTKLYLRGALLRALGCGDEVWVGSGALEAQEPFVAKQKPHQGKHGDRILRLGGRYLQSRRDIGTQWQRRREWYAVGLECLGWGTPGCNSDSERPQELLALGSLNSRQASIRLRPVGD
jgi:hypothetical protein